MPDAFNMIAGQPFAAVITAGGNGAASEQNTLTDQPGEKGIMGTLRYDVGGVRPVNAVAVLYTSGVAGDTLNVYSSNAADMSGATLHYTGPLLTDQALAAPQGYRHAFVWIPSTPTARYWQVEINVGGGGQRTVGRVAFLNALQVEYNPDYGDTSWGYPEPPEPEVTDAGITILQEMPTMSAPEFEFTISWATEAEMELNWQYLAPLAAKGKPVLVVRRPDAHAYRHSGIFWGLLRLQPFVAAQFDMHEVRGKIRSLL